MPRPQWFCASDCSSDSTVHSQGQQADDGQDKFIHMKGLMREKHNLPRNHPETATLDENVHAEAPDVEESNQSYEKLTPAKSVEEIYEKFDFLKAPVPPRTDKLIISRSGHIRLDVMNNPRQTKSQSKKPNKVKGTRKLSDTEFVTPANRNQFVDPEQNTAIDENGSNVVQEYVPPDKVLDVMANLNIPDGVRDHVTFDTEPDVTIDGGVDHNVPHDMASDVSEHSVSFSSHHEAETDVKVDHYPSTRDDPKSNAFDEFYFPENAINENCEELPKPETISAPHLKQMENIFDEQYFTKPEWTSGPETIKQGEEYSSHVHEEQNQFVQRDMVPDMFERSVPLSAKRKSKTEKSWKEPQKTSQQDSKHTENLFDDQYFSKPESVSSQENFVHSELQRGETEFDTSQFAQTYNQATPPELSGMGAEQLPLSSETLSTPTESRTTLKIETVTRAERKMKEKVQPNLENPQTAYDMVMKIRADKNTGKHKYNSIQQLYLV